MVSFFSLWMVRAERSVLNWLHSITDDWLHSITDDWLHYKISDDRLHSMITTDYEKFVANELVCLILIPTST